MCTVSNNIPHLALRAAGQPRTSYLERGHATQPVRCEQSTKRDSQSTESRLPLK
jgi:hypothetical protein